MTSNKKSALFICLGNICRSPIAEAVFLQTLKDRGLQDEWKVDSAAIGSWHVGKSPDHRATATLKKHNVPYNNRARQISNDDFNNFDYIFGMDEDNMEFLRERVAKRKTKSSKIHLLGEFDSQGERIIRDPYYDDGSEGFEKCYQQCVRCCKGFLDSL